MELPSIGKNCSEPNCNQLDYLPFQCFCHKIFCKDHFNNHAQICENKDNIFSNSKDKNNFLDSLKQCSESNCQIRSLLPFTCEKCSKIYCISHRYHKSCPEIIPKTVIEHVNKKNTIDATLKLAKSNIDQQIDTKLQKLRENNKKQSTANKVHLMRLKSKAIGENSIPVNERLYFLINYLTKSKSGEKTVFISKKWTVGRVIDSVASLCDVPNKNNDMNSMKLRLIKNGSLISDDDLSIQIEKLINSASVCDGDILELKHV